MKSALNRWIAVPLSVFTALSVCITGAAAQQRDNANDAAVASVQAQDDGDVIIQTSVEDFIKIDADPDFRFAYGIPTEIGKYSIPGEEAPISSDYYMSKYFVTCDQYKQFCDATDRVYPQYWGESYPAGKANHPVLYVSYADAVAYCEWLSGQTPGWTFRLPTEAEYENAMYPDGTTYPWGNSSGIIVTKNDEGFYNVENTYGVNCNTLLAAALLDGNGAYGPNYVLTYTKDKLQGEQTTLGALLSIGSNGSVSNWANHDTGVGIIFTDLFEAINATGGTTVPVNEGWANEYGLMGTSGNAWTWTASQIRASNGAEAGTLAQCVRGGSWYATLNSCSIKARGEGRCATEGVFNTIGFRLAADHAEAADVAVIDGEMISDTTAYPDGIDVRTVPVSTSGLLTLTVDGVEKNLTTGIYEGNALITVTEDVPVEYTAGNLTHHFRQAIYADATGLVAAKSVLAAVKDVTIVNKTISGGAIEIDGDEFNGVYVTGGDYTIENLTVSSESAGTGDNDFAGYGAAIMATGADTRLVLDQVTVYTKGVVHSSLIAGGGANVIVKNSTLSATEGELPTGYVFNTTLGHMKSVPWMLGLDGNNRATNMIGENTVETFINSKISSEGWGVLSVDDCRNVTMTVINSSVEITGESGYGAYVIGGAVDQFYGSLITVPDYAAILTVGGSVTYDDSTAQNVSALNERLSLGLTNTELAALKEQYTVVNTGRSSVMFHGIEASKDGLQANVLGATVINSDGAIFLSRGAAAYINVDGSKGAQLNTGSGVITQMVDLDKAVRVNDKDILPGSTLATYPGPWTQFYNSYDEIVKIENFDIYTQQDNDVVNNLKNIVLTGDFYNGITGKVLNMQGSAIDRGQNMVVNMDNTTVNGVISSSFAVREKAALTSADYKLIGEVTNIPCAAINNGAIVSLTNNSVWCVADNSFLTSLTLDATSCVMAGSGKVIVMTVNGVETAIEAGKSYTGAIVIRVEPAAQK